MNQLSLVIVALVAFTYFGGSYVPKVLKSNKQMLLGVVGGLVLGSFFGVRLVEGNFLTEVAKEEWQGAKDFANHPIDVTAEAAREAWHHPVGAIEDAIVVV